MRYSKLVSPVGVSRFVLFSARLINEVFNFTTVAYKTAECNFI